MFILFEGIVGTGKTTHLHKLSNYLKKKEIVNEVFKSRDSAQLGTIECKTCRETVSVDVREIQSTTIPIYLGFLGSITNLHGKILKVTNEGKWAVVDRYIYTQMAYTRKFCRGWIESVNDTVRNNIVQPDVIFWLTGSVDWLVKNRPDFKFSGFSVEDLKDLNRYYGESLPVSVTHKLDITKKTVDQTFQEIKAIITPLISEKRVCSSIPKKLSTVVTSKVSLLRKSDPRRLTSSSTKSIG